MRSKRVEASVRERVLRRIRTAIADGNDAEAMRIARELEHRWRSCEGRGASSKELARGSR